MPQMSPLSWLALYLFTIMLFLLTIILNYYMYNYTPKSTLTTKNKTHTNWKW